MIIIPKEWFFQKSDMRENYMRLDSLHSVIANLAAIPSFSDMEEPILEAIGREAKLRSFSRGEVVFREGEQSAGIYVVQSGWLKSYKISVNGREQVVRYVGPGEVFNEIGALAEMGNQATVEALEPSSVWIISRQSITILMARYPSIAQFLIRNLSNRLIHLMQMIEDLSLRSVSGRLARLLMENSADQVLSRRPWSTQSEMAARLGTVPDVLNRALRELSEDGLIQIDRHQIRILDRKGLNAKAQIDTKHS